MENPTSTSTPQPQPTAPVQPVPTLTPDAGAALLAELRGLRTALESNQAATDANRTAIERLADELTSDPEEVREPTRAPETILVTPAASARDERRKTPDASDVERTTSGPPKKQDDESDDDFLDRLRKLPPLGSPRRQWMEPRKLFEARRHDGAPVE